MRMMVATIVMLGLPALAVAQPATPEAGGVAPLPPIGLPLPQIGLPHPPTGLPAAETPPTRGAANRQAPRTRRPHRPGPSVVPVYVWPYLYDAPATIGPSGSPNDSATRTAAQPLVGRLLLEVAASGEQQLYVDGYYAGTLDDFAAGVELEAGPHAVEIRGPGFEALRFSVNIAPGRTITYRGTLKATNPKPTPDASAASSPPVAPTTPMVGYIVPGCYIGNVPPQDAALPAGCDISRVITIKR
jgi:hypothetical protein